MQSLQTQTLIHVGVELVIIGGMTFWINRKTGSLQRQIDELKNIIEEQQKLIVRHEQMLAHILGGVPPQGMVQQPQRHNPIQTNIPPQQQQPQRIPPTQHPNNQGGFSPQNSRPLSESQNSNASQFSNEDDEENIDQSIIDKLVESELKSINSQNETSPSEMELDFVGETDNNNESSILNNSQSTLKSRNRNNRNRNIRKKRSSTKRKKND